MTLMTADPKQFQIKEDGQIYYQSILNNPLPGVAIAQLIKGDTPLDPQIDWLPDAPLDGLDLLAATDKVMTWLGLYVARILEPLVKVNAEMDALPDPVKDICTHIHAGLGIVPRADVMDAIQKLDPEMRKTLRTRHIRLGPVLLFMPDLNKPAAVRLRAILWSLFHDKPLPAPVPKDGAVSVIVDPAQADPVFYQAIGYPLYGNRAIRIDMLDRVMNAIYENVKDNQFQARHQMAEWLGCSIPDLYTVLEAMGHKKLDDGAPVSSPVVDSSGAATSETEMPTKPPTETSAVVNETETTAADTPAPETTPATNTPEKTETATGDTPAKPAPAPKPLLATFRVWWPRKNGGPAKSAATPRGPRVPREKGPKTPPPFEYLDPSEKEARAAQESERAQKRDSRRSDDRDENGKSGGRPGAGRRDDHGTGRGSGYGAGKPGGGARKSKPNRMDKNLRLVSSAAAPASKPEDSPFAILAGLKFKTD